MKRKKDINVKYLNYILTSLATLIIVFILALVVYDNVLEQKAITIDATIIALNVDNDSNQLKVNYKVEKDIYTQTIKTYNNNYSVNDKIEIKYDINNPGKLVNNDHRILIGFLLIISVILYIISLKKTLQNLKSDNNLKKLKTKGLYLKANIVDIIAHPKKKGLYKLRSEYFNPLDKQKYIYDSNYTYTNLQEVINTYHNKIVIVYLEKENTGNYYVDLDSLFPQPQLVDVAKIMGDGVKKEEPKKEEPKKEEPKTKKDTKGFKI